MEYVPLHRRFVRWADDIFDAEAEGIWENVRHGDIDWPSLLEAKRIVVLAEAGSGKSRELEEQAKALASSGVFAFYATVQNVADKGLFNALDRAQRARFDEWKKSGDRGFFFIDSVDEARAVNIRIEDAFQQVADAIDGDLFRAHILFSSRVTDWQFKSDLKRFIAALPHVEEEASAEFDLPEIVGRALKNELKSKKKKTVEAPSVVLMASLDKDQVRQFAVGRGIKVLDGFLSGIDQNNLWHLARRPLDLGWLVDYWDEHAGFGTLAEMMESSLFARLNEVNDVHVAKRQIAEQRGMAGLERIGAAMVFGRTDKVLVPDPGATADGDFTIQNLLPDWSADDRRTLMRGAVFDPSTFGRVRLHNDNEGSVRGFLAARWLRHRLEGGATIPDVIDLLFADTYGLRVVRPSCAQTAAWLSLWNQAIANEVVSRNPMLLLRGGDPASLSPAIRAAALRAIVAMVASSDRWPGWIGLDPLRRFAAADTAAVIRELWTAYPNSLETRRLLLQLIEAGGLIDCADFAIEICLKSDGDQSIRIWAARALFAVGDSHARAKYAAVVKAYGDELSKREIGEAIPALFPDHISSDELIALLEKIDWHRDNDSELGLEHFGPQLIEKIDDNATLARLIAPLLGQLGPPPDIYGDETKREEAYYPTIRAAALALIGKNEPDNTPDIAFDAAIRLGIRRHFRTNDSQTELIAALHRTALQRRQGFWRAVETLTGKGFSSDQPFTNPVQLDMAGWPTGFQTEDIEWLLEDAANRPSSDDRMLAFVSALLIWRDIGKSDDVLEKLRAVANADEAMARTLAGWLSPPKLSKEEVALNRKIASQRARHAKDQAKRDKSWVDFITKLKSDPNALRTLSIRDDNNVDSRLFYFWEMLNNVAAGSSRYEIDDVSPVEPIFGIEVTAAAADGLIGYWRQHIPNIESARAPAALNTISKLDCMGIVGVSLEAKGNPRLAKQMTSAEAVLAAQFATIEMNGFPTWFAGLATEKPSEVRQVLLTEIVAQLEPPSNPDRHGMVQRVAYGPLEIMQLVAPQLLRELEARPSLPSAALNHVLSILRKGLQDVADKSKLFELSLDRFGNTQDPIDAGAYIYGAYAVDPGRAVDALLAKIDGMDSNAQSTFSQAIFARVFGDRIFGGGADPAQIPLEKLERLVLAAYRTIRVEDDPDHESGQAYSIDERHEAQASRNALITRLINTPGPATVEALRRVCPQIGILTARADEFILSRAEQDSEAGKWPAAEAAALEKTFDVQPHTAADLRRVALRKIEHVNHGLHHADFAQGRIVKGLPDENQVQIWIAGALDAQAHRAYTVERESQVVDGKMPDIRLRSGVQVSLPVEIKVADRMSLPELEEALSVQLIARYLRHQDARHGILLLVHKNARTEGWKDPNGKLLTFPEVVERLRRIASEKAGSERDAPQAAVAFIDVSDLAAAVPRTRSKPGTRKSQPRPSTRIPKK